MSSPDAPDFIEVYPDALDADTCRAIVARFDASGQDQPGRVGGGLYPELKHSRDISITGVAEWRDVEQRLNLAVLTGLQQYLRTYPFSLIAPLMLQQPDAEGELRRLRSDDIAAMDDAALMKLVMKVFVPLDAGKYPEVEVPWLKGNQTLDGKEWLDRALAGRSRAEREGAKRQP